MKMKTGKRSTEDRRVCSVESAKVSFGICFVMSLFFRNFNVELVAADGVQDFGSKVIKITDSTFQEDTQGFILVMFYAEWSGQSKKLFPVWSKLAEEFDADGNLCKAGVIDASIKHENPGSRFVHSLPMVLLFHNGELVSHFTDERSVKELKASVYKFVRLSSEILSLKKANTVLKLEELEATREERAGKEQSREALTAARFEKEVLSLNNDNFYAQVSTRDALVMVYTSWCEHCKPMEGDWLQLARDPPVPGLLVAKIELDHFNTFTGARLVESVPCVLFFRKSAVQGKFNGTRNLSNVRQWAMKMASLSAEESYKALANIHAQEVLLEQPATKTAEEKSPALAVAEDFRKILELTNDNFAEKTQGRSVLILFYTDWGDRSQLMKPLWVALGKDPDIGGMLGRFPEQGMGWSSELEIIHGYPAIVCARNGLIIDKYEGVQKLQEIKFYAQSVANITDEQAKSKHHALLQIVQKSRTQEIEKDRERVKSEEKRREEEVRKAKQLKRKQKSQRHG